MALHTSKVELRYPLTEKPDQTYPVQEPACPRSTVVVSDVDPAEWTEHGGHFYVEDVRAISLEFATL